MSEFARPIQNRVLAVRPRELSLASSTAGSTGRAENSLTTVLISDAMLATTPNVQSGTGVATGTRTPLARG
jgi:hypothetical protein